MSGAKFVGFIAIASLSGLGYIKYSQINDFNIRVQELEKNNDLKKYLFQSSEDSSYFVDELMDNFERQFNQSHLLKYKQTLLKMAEGKILETCAGSNRTLKFYNPGSDLTLIDWSPKMASIGITKNIPTTQFNYVIGDVTEMPFEDDSFDTVVDIFGLQHVMEPQKALKEIRRVCKKNGTIILMNQGLSDFVEFHYWENAISGQNLIKMGMYTNRNWQKLIKEFDFEVEHLERKKNGKIYIHILKNLKVEEAKAEVV